MTRNELALKLADAVEETERRHLISQNLNIADLAFARVLKDICLDSWTSNPMRAAGAAQSLSLLSKIDPQAESIALTAWADGVAAMINGQLRRAVTRFDDAQQKFHSLHQDHAAASTQVAKLYPLAMLGRYDEAIETGLRARTVFLECADFAAAGRIEHNLGNIFQISDRYDDAEELLRSAHERFVELKDFKTLAQITNSLAYVLSYRYKFAEAEKLYSEALQFAEKSDLVVTKAEIESNLGYFSLSQGRYDRALEFLGRARTSYSNLGMPHQSAVSELEMADAYLELNLNEEAAAIYSRVIPLFAEIGMSIEHARALANFARVQFVLGETAKALSLLAASRQIFASCRSEVGESTVLLREAEFLFAEDKFEETLKKLGEAEMPLARAGVKGAELLADFLRAESWRELGKLTEAQTLLEEILAEAEVNEIPPLTSRCLTALGLTARAAGDMENAERHFREAVSVIENLRAPLPSEDFRTAFFGDKLRPYKELTRICLENESRVGEAFEYVEKSRSRSLLEMVQGSGRDEGAIGSNVLDLRNRMVAKREELNWLYNQINRPTQKNTSRNLAEAWKLHVTAREHETEIAELTRQIQLCQPQTFSTEYRSLQLAALQGHLGSDTVLVEFAEIDKEFVAFVVTENDLRVFPQLARESEITELLSRLYFQLEGMRNNPRAVEAHFYELTLRTRQVLSELYDLLLRPLEKVTGLRRLVVSPHRALYYIPFHALYDGFGYVIESREIAYAPSAAVLQNCLEKPRRNIQNALFVGVSDKQVPFVNEEIKVLSAILSGEVLLNGDATLRAIIDGAANKDVLHLACHGQFRAENPLFSSLKLADSWLTVRDVYSLRLDADLVVLSACETGLNRIAPGEELLGLARGFFSAGANSLVLSLWNVHDATTADLMREFYVKVSTGQSPAAALRHSQREILRKRPHPFFWSPFFVIGRW